MTSLFLDTSSSYLNVAIIKDKDVLKSIYLFLEKDMSKYALLKIKEIIEELGLTADNIDEIIVVNGPGSYTGLRVGVTIAKTYAWGLNKKLIAVSSLYCMAVSITNASYIVPVIDARRNYLFAGIYDKNYNEILKDKYISKEELLLEVKKLKGTCIFVGTTDIKGLNIVKYNPNINNIMKYLKGKYVKPHELIPNYLKKTEAEENLEK